MTPAAPAPRFALIDGNTFYVSCERVFDPRLHNVPVVVAGNGDGCAIAISTEARALGVRTGMPLFQLPAHIRRQIHVRSANFALYGDLSARIVHILSDLFPRVEIYSIDENFIDVAGLPDAAERLMHARERILRWVGIPCCVGLGATRTLAKAGNLLAKRHSRRQIRSDARALHHAGPSDLADLAISDVWGIGKQLARRLHDEGIHTAADLVQTAATTLRQRHGVVMARLQRELQGTVCADLDIAPARRQQVMVSRTFAHAVEDPGEALVQFTHTACARLRQHHLFAGAAWLFLEGRTLDGRPLHLARTASLVTATQDTGVVMAAIRTQLKQLLQPGHRFHRAGIGLVDLSPAEARQGDLFAPDDSRRLRHMAVIDRINARFGTGTAGLGIAGCRPDHRQHSGQPDADWRPQPMARSPAYTTRWDQVLRVR